jgi:hypothetical protein
MAPYDDDYADSNPVYGITADETSTEDDQPKRASKKVSGRTEALMEQFKQMAEETYSGKAQIASERMLEDVPFTQKHIQLLNDENILDRLVDFGRQQVIDVDDVWLVTFLSQASCYSPPITYNGRLNRAQSHMMMIGDPSTAKSSIYNLAMRMFPKCAMPTNFTPSGFVGSINKSREKEKGVAEYMDRAIMVIDEMDKLMKRYPHLDGYLRTIMEDQRFFSKTSYGTIEYETHPVVLAGANPTGDTFRNELMSKQMPFKFGLLTRFDYLRPMAYNCADVNKISRHIANVAFQDAEEPSTSVITTKDVNQMYYALQDALMEERVMRVKAEKDMVIQLQETFEKLQKPIDDVPLLSVRDFMGSLRFLNSSATLHVKQRKIVNGAIVADWKDANIATYILETSAKSRELLLTSNTREAVATTPMNRARTILAEFIARNGGTAEKTDCIEHLKQTMGIGKTTAYEYIKDMANSSESSVVQDGLWDAKLRLK